MNLSFVITTYARAGTHFLQGLLVSTGLADPHEIFKLPDYTGKPQDLENMEALLQGGYERSINQEHFGCFIHAHDISFLYYLAKKGVVEIDRTKWISLIRLDKLKQALSYIIAPQSQKWFIRTDAETPVPDYSDYKDISKEDLYFYVMRCFLADQIWDTFYRDRSIEPHRLYYEHFLAERSWKPTVSGIFDFLEIPYDINLLNPIAMTKKFSNDVPHLLVEEAKQELSTRPHPLELKYLPHLSL